MDLVGQLERRAMEPAVSSDSSAAMKNSAADVDLDLSLWFNSGDVGSRKRLQESDEAVEAKKPKMEDGIVNFDLQMMPVIFQQPDGYCYACMVPCWVPCSMDDTENSVNRPGVYRNLAVDIEGVVAGDCQLEEVAGGSGLSSPGTSNSGTSVFQSFSGTGESNSTNESKSHSSDASQENPSFISTSRKSNAGQKKPSTRTKRRNKAALSSKRRALVYTRSAEGEKIDGYLCECPNRGVRILCDCHRRFFSPAGFVRHAGGPETQHPLRQITVVPS